MRFEYLLTIILIITPFSSIACSAAIRGAGWDKDELIEKSENIAIVKLNRIDKEKTVSCSGKKLKCKDIEISINILSPVKILKGSVDDEIRGGEALISVGGEYPMEHYDNDFNLHNDTKFWEEDIGRSEWHCCLCGPSHTYVFDEKYLLFEDAQGAFKSSEIIKSEDDKWLIYVNEKINNQKSL
jgi:hypothetical protein